MIASEALTQIWVGIGRPAASLGVFFGEFFEDLDEDRDHEGDDRDQHDDREAEDQRRVHQRRFDLAPQGVGFLDLEGDPVERLLEAARLLAGADHRPEEAVEDLRVALHRLLERAAGLDVGADARRPPP